MHAFRNPWKNDAEVFLDIDIDGELAAFKLGQAFVEARERNAVFCGSRVGEACSEEIAESKIQSFLHST